MNTTAASAQAHLLASLTHTSDSRGTRYQGEHRGADGTSIGVCIWPNDGGRMEIYHLTRHGIDWQIHLDGTTPTAVIGATLNAALATIPPTPDRATASEGTRERHDS